MPRASLTISRTTTCAAQSARVAVVKLDSSVRRAPSGRTLSPLPCAVLLATLSSRLPRSPCSNEQDDTRQESLPIGGGRSSHSGLRQHKRPLDGFGDRAQSKSSVSAPSSARTTTVRLTPTPGLRLRRASQKVQATALPFFEPRGDGLPGDAEGAGESTQTATFIVSAKYLFAFLFRISIAARLFATALTAVTAQVTLAVIRSKAVTHKSFALAMLTSQSKSDHR